MTKRLPIRTPAPPKAERPECLQCGKRMQPSMYQICERIEHPHGYSIRAVAVEWRGNYDGVRNTFCSNKCLAKFGWGFAEFFLNGGNAAGLNDKNANRLPAIRDARERASNMYMARDLAPHASTTEV